MPAYRHLLPAENVLFAPARIDRDLVRDFLFLFSRAEYSLKAAGFAERPPRGGISISWARFAKEVQPAMMPPPDKDIQQALRYLSAHPPQKQVLEGSHLVWRDRRKRREQTPWQFLVESATQVRHNLFHGGKDLVGPLAERDRALISSAMYVIAFALSLHDEIAARYMDIGRNEQIA